MNESSLRKAYEFLDLLSGKASEVLRREGMTEAEAERVADVMAREFIAENARRELYVPVAAALELEPRNREIWTLYTQPGPDGTRPFTIQRAEQLARQYRVTLRWVKSILKHQREQVVRTQQMALPWADEEV
jgi:Mor family transcriptional regulator